MLVKANSMTKTYKVGNIPVKALSKVDCSIDKGEIAVILGPSGSGKTTLLNILGGIDKPDHGRVIVNKINLTRLSNHQLTLYRRMYIGYVFQFYNLIPNLTVSENIEVASNISKNPVPTNKILKAVGLQDQKNKFPRELSGGQQQRVSFARALVKKPALLLCDEPTGSLDYDSSKQVLNIIEKINKNLQTTIIIVTHNEAIASMANRVIRMRSGEIVEDITQEAIPARKVTW